LPSSAADQADWDEAMPATAAAMAASAVVNLFLEQVDVADLG
jgi:hypothetical protein